MIQSFLQVVCVSHLSENLKYDQPPLYNYYQPLLTVDSHYQPTNALGNPWDTERLLTTSKLSSTLLPLAEPLSQKSRIMISLRPGTHQHTAFHCILLAHHSREFLPIVPSSMAGQNATRDCLSLLHLSSSPRNRVHMGTFACFIYHHITSFNYI